MINDGHDWYWGIVGIIKLIRHGKGVHIIQWISKYTAIISKLMLYIEPTSDVIIEVNALLCSKTKKKNNSIDSEDG